MKKTLLKKIGHLYATDETLHLAVQETSEKKKIGWDKYEYIFAHEMYLQCCIREDCLIVAIYMTRDLRLESKKPRYEIFVDRGNKEYITWDTVNQKWRSARVSMLDFPTYYSFSAVYVAPEDNRILTDYLGVTQDGVKGLNTYQESILEERLKKKHKKETSAWDAVMNLVPEKPKDWERWASRHGIDENYIFYDYAKKVSEGYCTWCEKTVPVKKPRHNAFATCKCCRHRIQYKAKGRAGRFYTKDEQVYLPQKCGDGFVIRQFSVQRYYQKGAYETPQIYLFEKGRVVYDKDLKGTQYYYGNYKHLEGRWIKGYPRYSFYYGYYDGNLNVDGAVYKRTVPALSHLLSRTGLPQLISSVNKLSPKGYLDDLEEAPYLERFIKAGLVRLTLDALYCQIEMKESNSLAKALGVDKYRLGRLRDHNGGMIFLAWLQYEKRSGKNIRDSVVRYFEEQRIEPKDLDYIRDSMSEERVCNYLKRQYALTGRSPKELLSTWRDYLDISKRVMRDVTLEIFYKPKDLVKAHAEVVQFCKDKELTLQAADIAKKYPDVDAICSAINEKYEYSDKNYVLIIPSRIEDIIQDGRALHHCTSYSDIYYERIQKRESYIAFLRKADHPEQAFYTVEFEPDGTVRQKRTVGDRQNADFEKAVGFIKKWQKAIQPRLTEEDYRLAKESTKLRIKELKELRRKNAKILHGHLAGKPLADVLEADLMEAALCMEEVTAQEMDTMEDELLDAA